MTFQGKVSASDGSPSCTKLNSELERSKWRPRADHTFPWCLEVKSINYGRSRAGTKNKIRLFHSKWKTWAFVTAGGSWKRRSMHFFYILQNHGTQVVLQLHLLNGIPLTLNLRHPPSVILLFYKIFLLVVAWFLYSSKAQILKSTFVTFVSSTAGDLRCFSPSRLSSVRLRRGFRRGPCPPLR